MSATVVQAPARWTLKELRERLGPALARASALRAVVFGSHARGTADGFSDLDLVVVLETDLPRFERPRLLDDLYRAAPMGLDLLVLTPAEFEDGLHRRMGIFDGIAREGVTLYERAGDPA